MNDYNAPVDLLRDKVILVTGAGDGIGANLLGDDSGGHANRSAEQGVWEFLGLDFLLEASSEVRVMRGATVEDADIVAAAGSRGSRAGVLGTGTFGAIKRIKLSAPRLNLSSRNARPGS